MDTLQPASWYWRHCGVQWFINRAIYWSTSGKGADLVCACEICRAGGQGVAAMAHELS